MQDPDYSQSLNRYSYVLNNPLSYTDPSGYFFQRLFNTVLRPLINIVGCTAGPASAQPYICAATVAATSAAAGQSLLNSLRDGAIAGVSAFAFNEIGSLIEADTISSIEAAVLHGGIGAATAAAQGGNPLTGFITSTVSKGISLDAAAELDAVNDIVFESVLVALVGGTTSAVAGGNFANGAISAAIGYVYNQKSQRREKKASETEAAFYDVTDYISEFKLNNPGLPIPLSQEQFEAILYYETSVINNQGTTVTAFDLLTADGTFYFHGSSQFVLSFEFYDIPPGTYPGVHINYYLQGILQAHSWNIAGPLTPGSITLWNSAQGIIRKTLYGDSSDFQAIGPAINWARAGAQYYEDNFYDQ